MLEEDTGQRTEERLILTCHGLTWVSGMARQRVLAPATFDLNVVELALHAPKIEFETSKDTSTE